MGNDALSYIGMRDVWGGQHALVVVNDTIAVVSGRLRVNDVDTGELLSETTCEIAANDKALAGHIRVAERPAFWRLEWSSDGYIAVNHYLAGPRPFDLAQYLNWMEKVGWSPAAHVSIRDLTEPTKNNN